MALDQTEESLHYLFTQKQKEDNPAEKEQMNKEKKKQKSHKDKKSKRMQELICSSAWMVGSRAW